MFKKLFVSFISFVMIFTTIFVPTTFSFAKTNDEESVSNTRSLSQEEKEARGMYKCTGVYVGKDICVEDTPIIARCEDQSSGCYTKLFMVQPQTYGKGKYIVDTGNGQSEFFVEVPDLTYKYTHLKDGKDLEDGPYYAACMNEKGVAIDGTISTEVSDEYGKIDPVKRAGDGIRESILPGIVACQAESSRHGVEVLAKYIDKYGSQECGTTFIQDKKETWIFEIYGGQSYAAMRLPTDQMSVFGNEIMIDWVDFNSTEDQGYVFSKDLKENLDKTKHPVKDVNGRYNICQTIDPGERDSYSNLRTWRGHQLFAPETAGKYSSKTFYPLLFKPDKEVSVLDIMKLFGDRYEGTEYDMGKKGNETLRPIGTTRTSDAHIIQTYEGLPDCCCNLQWLAMGNPEHAMFVPAFSGITDTFEKYKEDTGTIGYIDDSFYYVSKTVCMIAETDREFLSQGVKDYVFLKEKQMLERIKEEVPVIKARYDIFEYLGNAYVTSLGLDMAENCYNKIIDLGKSLTYCCMYNLNDRGTIEGKEPFRYSDNMDMFTEYGD